MAFDPYKSPEKESPYDALTREDVGSAVPDSMRPAHASAAPLPGGEAGPTASGHVNFDQIYNANAGTAAREANKVQTSARLAGQSVRTGAMGAQEQFGQAVRTGGVAGPDAAQRNWASNSVTGVKFPKLVVGSSKGDAATGQERTATERQEGLDGSFDPVKAGWTLVTNPDGTKSWAPPGAASGNPDAQNPELSDETLRAQVEAGAKQKYGGPDSLSDLEQYQQLLKDATAAEDVAGAMGRGNDGLQAMGLGRLDASLLGASGRRGFEDIAKDQSNLRGELASADAASKGLADDERARSESASAAYRGLLGEHDGRVAADQSVSDSAKNIDSSPLAGTRPDWNRPQELDEPSEFSELWRDFGLTATGSSGKIDKDEDGKLLDALELTEGDHEALAKMSAAERRAWFEQRKKEKGL